MMNLSSPLPSAGIGKDTFDIKIESKAETSSQSTSDASDEKKASLGVPKK